MPLQLNNIALLISDKSFWSHNTTSLIQVQAKNQHVVYQQTLWDFCSSRHSTTRLENIKHELHQSPGASLKCSTTWQHIILLLFTRSMVSSVSTTMTTRNYNFIMIQKNTESVCTACFFGCTTLLDCCCNLDCLFCCIFFVKHTTYTFVTLLMQICPYCPCWHCK
jgi:hypothetical protein